MSEDIGFATERPYKIFIVLALISFYCINIPVLAPIKMYNKNGIIIINKKGKSSNAKRTLRWIPAYMVLSI